MLNFSDVNSQLMGLPGEADSMQLGPHQAETWSDNQHCLCNDQHDSVFLISESIFIKRSGKISNHSGNRVCNIDRVTTVSKASSNCDTSHKHDTKVSQAKDSQITWHQN